MKMDPQILDGRIEAFLAHDPDVMPALPTRGMQDLVQQLQLYKGELEASNAELRDAERKLAASRDRYARLYDSAPAGHLCLDDHDRVIEANLPAARMLGVARDRLVKLQRFADFVVPEDRNKWQAYRQNVAEPDGAERCDITLTRADDARWVARLEISLLPNEAPNEQACMLQMFDVSREHNIEQQLRRAQKLEAVGRLAGGVAHDFNNMLMGILGYAQLCKDELPAHHPAQECLSEIDAITKRSADLTRQLLAFASRQTVTAFALDLNATVEGMLKLLRRLIGENIDLTWLPGESVWPVTIDPSQVDQIMANLCINASDAIDGTGTMIIETRNTTLDEAYSACHLGVAVGEYVLLSIRDNGRGMDRDTLDHVFEPFYTTKGVGKGTGMGLASIFGIMKQTGGNVEVSSKLGKGTTFNLYFPRCFDEIRATRNVKTETFPRGTETVLLVEDEKGVRQTTCAILESLGYNVLAKKNPLDALQLATDPSMAIDLLITDVVMPGMNGRVLVERLLTERPGLRCLYISGFPDDTLEVGGVRSENDVDLLPKPFTKSVLAHKVRMVLDNEPGNEAGSL